MSKLPDSVKRSMRVVLTDFDLSMMVSVPTSMRPIDLGSILYLLRRPLTAITRNLVNTLCSRRNWVRRTVQSKRVDVFAVITASHVLLAKTNGVLSGRNAIKDFEVCLRDALIPGK